MCCTYRLNSAHFLFNNLNNLYSYAIEKSPKTPTIILELASVLRYMLYGCKEDFVMLHKEIEHLRHYTALNELHIENRGEIKFTTDIENDHFKIVPLILSVFVENAFKHSTASQSDNINIDINIATSTSGILTFNCSNSFSTLDANTTISSQGIGLANVTKRLDILYPNKHTLNLTALKEQYLVTLELQLN